MNWSAIYSKVYRLTFHSLFFFNSHIPRLPGFKEELEKSKSADSADEEEPRAPAARVITPHRPTAAASSSSSPQEAPVHQMTQQQKRNLQRMWRVCEGLKDQAIDGLDLICRTATKAELKFYTFAVLDNTVCHFQFNTTNLFI